MFQASEITEQVVHHYVSRTCAFKVLVIGHVGRDHRVTLDLEQWGPLGWEPLPERDVRDWLIDLDLPWAGMDRADLVRILSDRLGVEHPHEPLDCEMPVYEMTDYDVDAFAASLGE